MVYLVIGPMSHTVLKHRISESRSQKKPDHLCPLKSISWCGHTVQLPKGKGTVMKEGVAKRYRISPSSASLLFVVRHILDEISRYITKSSLGNFLNVLFISETPTESKPPILLTSVQE